MDLCDAYDHQDDYSAAGVLRSEIEARLLDLDGALEAYQKDPNIKIPPDAAIVALLRFHNWFVLRGGW